MGNISTIPNFNTPLVSKDGKLTPVFQKFFIDLMYNVVTFNEVGFDVSNNTGTLAALAQYNTAGLLTQTGVNTFTGRTLTVQSNVGLTVTNGSGVSGNPLIGYNITSLPSITSIDGSNDSIQLYNKATAQYYSVSPAKIAAFAPVVNIVNFVYTSTSGQTDCTTQMPLTGASATNVITDGNQVLTLAYTPLVNHSTLIVDAYMFVRSNPNAFAVGAIFQDSGTNAVSGGNIALGTTNYTGCLTLKYITNSTGASTTFAVRVGASSTSTTISVGTGDGGVSRMAYLSILEVV